MSQIHVCQALRQCPISHKRPGGTVCRHPCRRFLQHVAPGGQSPGRYRFGLNALVARPAAMYATLPSRRPVTITPEPGPAKAGGVQSRPKPSSAAICGRVMFYDMSLIETVTTPSRHV